MLAAAGLMNSAWRARGEQESSEESPRLLARHHGSGLVGIEACGSDGSLGTLAAGVPAADAGGSGGGWWNPRLGALGLGRSGSKNTL
jgi:hypothetical protein